MALGGCDPLGDREYRVRDAHQARLERAGWLAAPLLWDGMQSPSPEVAERCHTAWSRLYARHSLPRVVCRVIDASGRFDKHKDSWEWVHMTPHLCGGRDEDMQHVLQLATRPVPRRMPAAPPGEGR
jgi:hypothetical protein